MNKKTNLNRLKKILVNIDSLNNEQKLTEYQNAWAELINEHDFKYFVTLTFSKDLSVAKNPNINLRNSKKKAIKFFSIFAKRLSKRIHGQRSKKTVEMVPVLEFTAGGRPHFHVAIKETENIQDEYLQKSIMYYWKSHRYTSIRYMEDPKNHDWFQVIRPGTQKRVVNYMLKNIHENSNEIVIVDYLYPLERDRWKKVMEKFQSTK